MHMLIFNPRALQMQKDAYDWYELQKEGLGELFLKELFEKYHKLEISDSLRKTGRKVSPIAAEKNSLTSLFLELLKRKFLCTRFSTQVVIPNTDLRTDSVYSCE